MLILSTEHVPLCRNSHKVIVLHNPSAMSKAKKLTLVWYYQLDRTHYSHFSSFSMNGLFLFQDPGESSSLYLLTSD